MNSRSIKLLIIEDTDEDFLLLQESLTFLPNERIFKRVQNEIELKEALESGTWDLVVSELKTQNLSLDETLVIVRSHSLSLPCLLYTRQIEVEELTPYFHRGLTEVLIKTNSDRLYAVISRLLDGSTIVSADLHARQLVKEALAAKEQMIAIVSHDIKNPLSAIRLEAQMLQRVASRNQEPEILKAEVLNLSNRILKTTDRLRLLISDLLDRNKNESGLTVLQKSLLAPELIVREALDTFKPLLQEKDIELRVFVADKLPLLLIDKNKLIQVISNLISNSIRFSPVAGKIDINIEFSGGFIKLSVTDDGPGIKTEHLTKVFEKYWAANTSSVPAGNTGLGLYICKTIVNAHGGEITVENIPGRGVKFSVTIPVNRPVGKKVAVIDDDEDLRDVISWHLGREGFSVQTFNNPLEALAVLQSPDHTPGLILADYKMDGMRGGEFLKLKKATPYLNECPVIMISAASQEAQRELDKDLVKEFITKPLDLEGLVSQIDKYFLTSSY